MSFKSLGLSSQLLTVLKNEGYSKAYKIQKKAIPAIIDKNDILGIAKTGSGKTASYVLPIIMNMQGRIPSKNRYINVLITVPTRELAIQVNETINIFTSGLKNKIKSLAVYGGVSINTQMIAMQGVEILVATPGRLLELVESNAMSLSEVQTVVIDEADKMLNLGFKDEMEKIFYLLPKKRQNLLFSATLSKDIDSFKQVLLNNPTIINIEEKDEVSNVELINQMAYFVNEDKKGPLLRYLINNENMQQVLVFVSSIKRADNVAKKLRNNGIDTWAIHSKKSQGARNNLLTKFKNKKLRVLVATDLISRGIDIEFLPYVINYELPRSPKDYIHRIGRTGRAEKPGIALSLITPNDKHHFKVIQKKMGKAVTMIDSDNIDF